MQTEYGLRAECSGLAAHEDSGSGCEMRMNESRRVARAARAARGSWERPNLEDPWGLRAAVTC